ncbi:MAG: hypothetical protein IPH07_39755 [Deltaproteobacteria bacterium]|nr:hypothetical protein [Deltaproteobacteria bacterium]MBK8241021.1 hypothetical protein [Deltaproteobacteria bacterium]MBK8713968.1 hypothetical protein [Deltaproteobacteria bacterium]MBP7291730.1 hypothetical protein [Nannocystaceae bacterium]
MGRCRGNLGPRQRRLRWQAAAAAALTIAALLPFAETFGVLVVLVVLVGLGSFCALQARAHTCAVLAMRGLRNLDRGVEPEPDHLARVQAIAAAHRIVLGCAGTTVGAAVLAMLC